MDSWKIKLVNSDTIIIKAKKKDLQKTDKTLLNVKKLENDSESEILLNRNNVLWYEKQEVLKAENE